MDKMITKTVSNTITSSYIDDIKSMMFAFGDSESPLDETATIIEEILREQMNTLLEKLADAAELRGSKAIGYEDVIFLMRKNPVKVQRLINYLGVLDASGSVGDHSQGADENLLNTTKRVKRCKLFIGLIDTNGMLKKAAKNEICDPQRNLRLKRMDFLTRQLEGKKYEAFCKARQVKFLDEKSKNQQKFYNWVTLGAQDHLNGLKIEKNALEILSYLAYETVGHLVDMAMLVRKDMNLPLDPLDKTLSAPMSFNPSFPMVQLPEATNDNANKKLKLEPTNSNGEQDDILEQPQQPEQEQSILMFGTSSQSLGGPLRKIHVEESVRRLAQNPTSIFGQDQQQQLPESFRLPSIVL